MSLIQETETVVACDACGFAGLSGLRRRDWLPYRMAASEERCVRFAVCTACGVSHVRASHGGPPSRQPGPLSVVTDAVRVAPWEVALPGQGTGACPACGGASGLLWSVPDAAELNGVWCPICWGGPLRKTDRRARHPEW